MSRVRWFSEYTHPDVNVLHKKERWAPVAEIAQENRLEVQIGAEREGKRGPGGSSVKIKSMMATNKQRGQVFRLLARPAVKTAGF